MKGFKFGSFNQKVATIHFIIVLLFSMVSLVCSLTLSALKSWMSQTKLLKKRRRRNGSGKRERDFKIWKRGMHLLNEWNWRTKTRRDTYLREMTKRSCKTRSRYNKIMFTSSSLIDLRIIWENMRTNVLHCLFSSSQAYEEAQKKLKMAEEDQKKMVRKSLIILTCTRMFCSGDIC